MLHDQFGEFLRVGYGAQLPPVLREPFQFMEDEVSRAPRYSLDRAAVAMVQNISLSKPSTFLKAMPIIRLPAPSIWIEFAFNDRMDWLREAERRGFTSIATMEQSSAPSRLGFLLKEFEHDGERLIEVHATWSHGENVEVGLKMMIIVITEDSKLIRPEYVAMLRERLTEVQRVEGFTSETNKQVKDPAELEAAITLESRIKAIPAHYWEIVWKTASPAKLREMHAKGDYDMSSEWRFVLALIACLNSRNLIQYGEEEDFAPLNRKRAKAGKPKLKSFRPVTLNLSKVQRRRIINYVRDKGVRARPDEPQFVMGHLKLRRTGVFWWCPHSRYGEATRPREFRVTA